MPRDFDHRQSHHLLCLSATVQDDHDCDMPVSQDMVGQHVHVETARMAQERGDGAHMSPRSQGQADMAATMSISARKMQKSPAFCSLGGMTQM